MISSQLHRNAPLENVSLAYTPVGYIADDLSPKFMVEKESNSYYVYSKDTMQLPETLRGDKSEANMANFNISTATYLLDEHAIKELVTDRQRENADKAIRPDVDVTEFLTGIIQRRRELDLATIVQFTGTWANITSLTSTLAWSANTTTSNPITQIDSAATVVLVNSAKNPNTIAINDQSFKAAKEHVSILDRIKYTSPDSVTPQILARLFNVDRVLVASAMYNSADEGLTDTMARIWTDTAWIGYIESLPGLMKVTALQTFWKSNTGMPQMVRKWREEKLRGDMLEVSAMFQNKVVASDCGYLIVNTNQ